MFVSSRLKWVFAIGGVIVGALLIWVVYKVASNPVPTFLITSSPQKTYTVYLRGKKSKPLVSTAEVRFDVFKRETPFLADKFLYSADVLDFPFEFRYPMQRWLSERCVQFYKDEYFKNTAADTLVVVNNTSKTIKYAKIESTELILVFELPPGSTATIPSSPSQGDLKWLAVDGDFMDGTSIKSAGVDLPVTGAIGSKTFYVEIQAHTTTIEMRN